ncbi:hypothetical protein MNBD_GAMMA12-1816 [hydrothermal vent metagenome]|uniref:Uncharacterized protein n=1 Tax=hydrothermal vent metagenome TaxID=652676 RepID=A0A3B0XU63_9ZZZZ
MFEDDDYSSNTDDIYFEDLDPSCHDCGDTTSLDADCMHNDPFGFNDSSEL